MPRTIPQPFTLCSLSQVTIEDEASFRHVGLYADLKEVLRRANYRFRILPAQLAGRWDRALLLNLMVTKVLSAQYLIWCLPFAALVPGRRGRALLYGLAGIFFLTQLIYPTLYGALIAGSDFVFALLLLRNFLLCAVGGLGLFWLWRGQLGAAPERLPRAVAASDKEAR